MAKAIVRQASQVINVDAVDSSCRTYCFLCCSERLNANAGYATVFCSEYTNARGVKEEEEEETAKAESFGHCGKLDWTAVNISGCFACVYI